MSVHKNQNLMLVPMMWQMIDLMPWAADSLANSTNSFRTDANLWITNASSASTSLESPRLMNYQPKIWQPNDKIIIICINVTNYVKTTLYINVYSVSINTYQILYIMLTVLNAIYSKTFYNIRMLIHVQMCITISHLSLLLIITFIFCCCCGYCPWDSARKAWAQDQQLLPFLFPLL